MSRKPSRKSQKAAADKLCGEIVRSRGYCELEGKDSVRCGGPRQWAHIVGRRFLATRWRPDAALCLCAGHHVYYTHNPELWREKLDELWPGRYAKLWRAANSAQKVDLGAVLERLKADA